MQQFLVQSVAIKEKSPQHGKLLTRHQVEFVGKFLKFATRKQAKRTVTKQDGLNNLGNLQKNLVS